MRTIMIILLMCVVIPGFSQKKEKPNETLSATCTINSVDSIPVSGTIVFIKTKEGVRIIGNVEGLKQGRYGIHIQNTCDNDAGHYNPSKMPHGGPQELKSHKGDLGNVVVDRWGKAHIEFTDPWLQLKGKQSLIGKVVTIHARPDDLRTQPDGNSGPVIGCGKIELNQN